MRLCIGVFGLPFLEVLLEREEAAGDVTTVVSETERMGFAPNSEDED